MKNDVPATPILIINQRKDRLADLVANQVKGQTTVVKEFANLTLKGQRLLWLADVDSPVDSTVFDLVDAVDSAAQAPGRIVLWSPAGTADDADDNQVVAWWGPDGKNLVLNYLYAIKMVDELELPYSVVRTVPIGEGAPSGQVVSEGEPLRGNAVNPESVAHTLAAELATTGPSHSLGLGESSGFKN